MELTRVTSYPENTEYAKLYLGLKVNNWSEEARNSHEFMDPSFETPVTVYTLSNQVVHWLEQENSN